MKRTREESALRRRTYMTWNDMRQRCTNPKKCFYERYGGRGITICDEWRDFAAFLRDMGYRPDGLTLERIDNDKGYSKDNCVWATQAQQRRNQSTTQMLTYRGETLCLKDWANRIGISQSGLWLRVNKFGWNIEKAISTPARKRYWKST